MLKCTHVVLEYYSRLFRTQEGESMQIIQFQPVAAMFAALFVFGNPVWAGMAGASTILVSPTTVAGLWKKTLFSAA